MKQVAQEMLSLTVKAVGEGNDKTLNLVMLIILLRHFARNMPFLLQVCLNCPRKRVMFLFGV